MSTLIENVEALVDASNNIKRAIREKGVEPEGGFSTFASAIDQIETGVDVSDTTATEDDVLNTKKFHKADGTLADGNITVREVSPEGYEIISGDSKTFEKGYYGSNFDVRATGLDISDTTAVESDVLKNKVFHKADGSVAEGSMKNHAGYITPTTYEYRDFVSYVKPLSEGFYDTNSYLRLDSIPKPNYSAEIDFDDFEDTVGHDLHVYTKSDGFAKKGTGYHVELNDFADQIGVYPEIIASGESILGVEGTFAGGGTDCTYENVIHVERQTASKGGQASFNWTGNGIAKTIIIRGSMASSITESSISITVININDDGTFSALTQSGTNTVISKNPSHILSASETSLLIKNNSSSYSYAFVITVFGEKAVGYSLEDEEV